MSSIHNQVENKNVNQNDKSIENKNVNQVENKNVNQVENKNVNQVDKSNDNSDNQEEFVSLIVDNNFEISTTYPFIIKRKSDGFMPKDCIYPNGYVYVKLNNERYLKHRLIATQFIENPNNLPEVDHINHDKTDYHLSNLRWVSSSTNHRNKTSNRGIHYQYVDEIPGDSIVVDEYGTNEFENYYFHDNIFYFYNGIQYRKLHVNERRDGAKFVCLLNTNGKVITVFYSKFKRLHDL